MAKLVAEDVHCLARTGTWAWTTRLDRDAVVYSGPDPETARSIARWLTTRGITVAVVVSDTRATSTPC